MGKKASGQELIEHDSHLVDHISEHFNNPEVSDVTLTVGDQVFAAHRFVLALQNKVFHRMLLSENWKESAEKKVSLEESPRGMSAFSDFLRFFYTGKLTLTIANVCGIHTLADKYDVPVLKEDCLGFMKDVLTGVHGDALKAGLEWLQYVEQFVPDILPACYGAIRTNFESLFFSIEAYKHQFERLNVDQIKKILTISNTQDELVLLKESTLIDIIEKTKWKTQLLPFVRFSNINWDDLHEYESKTYLRKYCNQAYKIHAERSNILGQNCKRQRLSEPADEVSCSCTENNGYLCPHINPRIYTDLPFSDAVIKMNDGNPKLQEPVDLSDLLRYSQKMHFSEDSDRNAKWSTHVCPSYAEDPICETYKVTPASSHVGRRFTLAINAGTYTDPDIHTTYQCNYCIKFTGVVTVVDGEIEPIFLNSPLRLKAGGEIYDSAFYGISILLHKQ